ncbi:neuromedin-U receptor 2-like [Montipora foliosa]|uniref:neuromedin-U receptor 2-like n=1 Tax=Montipora foliosa TaxID=591990 RepID=UPI0035F208E4
MNQVTSNATEYLMPPSWATTLLVSGTFLAVICPLTVLSNFLLLIAIYKDPFKTFRTPSAYFLVGLAFVDLITGLIPEPMMTTCYYRFYNNHPGRSHCVKILHVAGTVAAITANTSFFLVLAFTFAQYAALAFPFKFKRLITVRNTIACVVGLLLYAILFETLQLVAGVPREVIAKIDLHLHSTFSLFLTIIIYLMLQRAFGKQQLKKRRLMLKAVPRNIATSEGSLEIRETFTPSERPTRQKLIEKNFVRLNLAMIIILLVCSQPSAIMWYVFLYSGEKTKVSLSLRIAGVVTNNTLFLKSLLDPFVFAWRLPKYRKALKKLFGREE